MGKSGMTFVSREKKIYPICHVCDKLRKRGLEKCNQISKKVDKMIGKHVEADAFNDKNISSGNSTATGISKAIGRRRPTKDKTGMTTIVVKHEEDTEETEIKECRLLRQN